MFKDIMLPLPSHPKTVSRSAVRRALAAASTMDAHVTCLVNEPAVPVPITFQPFSSQFERELTARQSEVSAAAQAQLVAFNEEAAAMGIAHDGRILASPSDSVLDTYVAVARLRDLTIVPFIAKDEGCAQAVQALAFDSGRPVLVLPDDGHEEFSLGKVVIGWDFSRAAARAVGDALPLLRQAGDVRVVVVSNDKEASDKVSTAEFMTHLSRVGVSATLDEVQRGKNTIGEALDKASQGADLLVMGAFGHSRVRDFLLGGATRHVLAEPRIATFLSH